MSRVNLENSELYNPLIKTGLKQGITVLPDAAAAIDEDMGPVIYMTPTASRILTLPPVTAAMRGLTLFFITQGAFTLVLKNQAAATIATVPANIGQVGMLVCTGDATTGIGGWIGGL